MKVVVTGGSGFIGSHVVDVLVEQGYEIVNIDINPPHRDDIEHLNGSILDRELIDYAVRGARAVYHIGGFSNIDLVKGHPIETIELNVMSTTYLLDACRKHEGVHFVYASSVFAFDRRGHLYTTSKAASERIIEDYYSLYKTPYTILRFSTVYGPRNRGVDVVYLFVNQALKGRKIEIHGSGNQRRNFTHVRDIAEASALVIRRKKCLNKIMVIGSDKSLSINELANKVKSLVNPNCEIVFHSIEREYDYQGAVDEISNSYSVLEWKPRISIDDGIKELSAIIGSKTRHV